MIDTARVFEEVYKDGEYCDGCEYMHIYREYHPWGDTEAPVTFRECNITMAAECMGVEEVMKKLLEEDE